MILLWIKEIIMDKHYTYLITDKNGDTRVFCVTSEYAQKADELVSKQLKDGETFECIEYEDADW